MEGVPLPIKKDELADLSGSGLSAVSIADNIAVTIGSSTHFRYADQYLQFLNRLFDSRLIDVFCGKSGEAFAAGDCRKAMAYVRAGMMFRGDDLKAMFSYACGCRYWYLQLEGSEDAELIKILKAEATEYFEHVTTAFPEYAPAWYYLGYAYINAGQYLKAQISWKKFLAAADRDDEGQAAAASEIEERLSGLDDPVKIEKGMSLLVAGRLEEGLAILEPYTQTTYDRWWPLHYSLAGAYRELGHDDEAIEGYLKVLKLSPSNVESMDALSELYLLKGDDEKSLKYANKASIIRKQMEEKPEG